MFNSRKSVGSKPRNQNPFKISLGNSPMTNQSDVITQRKLYVMSSSKNSKDVPDWMSRTSQHYSRDKNKNVSMFSNPLCSFDKVQQTYVYARTNKYMNPEGQFNKLSHNKTRSTWEMKNHTFEFDWPKKQHAEKKVQKPVSISGQSMYQTFHRPTSRQNEIMKFDMPKYGYFESPLHMQRQTPIKIGHPYIVNSTFVK